MSLFDTKATNWGDDDDDEKKDASKLSGDAPAFSFGAPPPAAAAPATFSFDAPKEPARTSTERTTSNQSSVGNITETLSKQAVSVVETVKTAEGDTIQVQRADGAAALVAARTWEELNLDPALLKGVYLANFAKPFKIQEAALRARGVPSCRDAFDATRVHLLMKWVVSFSSLRPFGPRCSAQAIDTGRLQEDAGAREFIGPS